MREIKEETGYSVEVVEEIKIKKRTYEHLNISAEAHYFLVKIVGEKEIFRP